MLVCKYTSTLLNESTEIYLFIEGEFTKQPSHSRLVISCGFKTGCMPVFVNIFQIRPSGWKVILNFPPWAELPERHNMKKWGREELGRAENEEIEIKWHVATWWNSVVMESQEIFAIFNETNIRINFIKGSNIFIAELIFHICLKPDNWRGNNYFGIIQKTAQQWHCPKKSGRTRHL